MENTTLTVRQPESLAPKPLAEEIDRAFLEIGFSRGEDFTNRATISSVYDEMTSAADARIFGGYDKIDDAKRSIQAPMYVFENTDFGDHEMIFGFSLNADGPPFVLKSFTYHEDAIAPKPGSALDTYFDGNTYRMKDKRYSGYANSPRSFNTYQEAINWAKSEKDRIITYSEKILSAEHQQINMTTEGFRLNALIASGQALADITSYLESLQSLPLETIVSLAMVMEKKAKRKDEPYSTIAKKLWEIIDEKAKPENPEHLLKTISTAARLANDEFRATTPAEEPNLSSLNLDAQLYLHSSLVKAYGIILGLNNISYKNGQWQAELLSYESDNWKAKTPELKVKKSSTETAPSFEELLKQILKRLHAKHEEANTELRRRMHPGDFY